MTFQSHLVIWTSTCCFVSESTRNLSLRFLARLIRHYGLLTTLQKRLPVKNTVNFHLLFCTLPTEVSGKETTPHSLTSSSITEEREKSREYIFSTILNDLIAVTLCVTSKMSVSEAESQMIQMCMSYLLVLVSLSIPASLSHLLEALSVTFFSPSSPFFILVSTCGKIENSVVSNMPRKWSPNCSLQWVFSASAILKRNKQWFMNWGISMCPRL